MAWTGSAYAIAWAYHTSGDSEIWYTLLDLYGNFLAGPMRLTFASGDSENPVMTWAGYSIALAWEAGRTGKAHVYFQLFTEEGIALTPAVDLTPASGGAHHPDLTIDPEGYALVWADKVGTQADIAFARVDLVGNLLVGPRFAYASDLPSDYPTVAWSPWSYGIAWEETLSPDNQDIRFGAVDLRGNTVLAPVAVSNTPRDSRHPDLAWSPQLGHFGLVFQDDIGDPGESELHYFSLEELDRLASHLRSA